MEVVGRLKTCLIRRKIVRKLATQTIITLLPNFWMFAHWKLMLDRAEEISRFMLLTRIPKDAKSFSTEVGQNVVRNFLKNVVIYEKGIFSQKCSQMHMHSI